ASLQAPEAVHLHHPERAVAERHSLEALGDRVELAEGAGWIAQAGRRRPDLEVSEVVHRLRRVDGCRPAPGGEPVLDAEEHLLSSLHRPRGWRADQADGVAARDALG